MNSELILFLLSIGVLSWAFYQYMKGLFKDDPRCGWRNTDQKNKDDRQNRNDV